MRVVQMITALLLLTFAARTEADDARPDVAAVGARRALTRIRVGVDSHGELRTAWVHRPAGQGPFPVIVAFHGGQGTNGKDDMAYRWRRMFDQGVVLVFPNGQLSEPELGAWYLDDPEDMRHVDFVLDLLDIVRGLGGDPDRTWATGMSAGAQMTFDLACKASHAFRAFAPVAGLLLADRAAACDPEFVRPLQLIHGTEDDHQPYDGRVTPDGDPYLLSAPASLEFFANRAGCSVRDRDVTVLPDTDPRTVVEHWALNGCQEPIEHFKIIGGGHSWPGGDDEVDATEEIVDFFRRVGD